MMGSPTSESAQWRTAKASRSRSAMTPGAPRKALTMATCLATASPTMSSGASVFQRHSRPTGFLWWRQQKVHLFAQARLGVASMQREEVMPYMVCL